jgi:glycerate kinase
MFSILRRPDARFADMRVLVAYDKFKDSMTAEEACEGTASVLRELHPEWTLDLASLTDGGDGFGAILTESANGQSTRVNAAGPFLESTEAMIGIIEIDRLPVGARDLLTGLPVSGRLAIIEMASINGLAMVPPEKRSPWTTSTLGTGQLIRAAANAGVNGILLGVGGSATSDLGLGALAALGYEFRNSASGTVHPPVPEVWPEIIGITGVLNPSTPPIWIACDVDNPLLGERGAVAVFGPQKGLKESDRPRLEAESLRLADLLCQYLGCDPDVKTTPGAGAAGGISFGLMAAARARLVSGSELMTAWMRLNERIGEVDLVITGEGRFDRSSLSGKGPGEIATRSLDLGKTTHVFAGSIETGLRAKANMHEISPAEAPLADALRNGKANLKASIASVFGKE